MEINCPYYSFCYVSKIDSEVCLKPINCETYKYYQNNTEYLGIGALVNSEIFNKLKNE